MAVGVAEVQATITTKISLGNGKYMYIGTLAFGSEYATGGDTLGTAAGERFSLPALIDYIGIQGGHGYILEYVKAEQKIKVYWPAGMSWPISR